MRLAVGPATERALAGAGLAADSAARSPAALRQAVARLDRVSLASGKAITRSLAAKVLADDGLADDAMKFPCRGLTPRPRPHGFL